MAAGDRKRKPEANRMPDFCVSRFREMFLVRLFSCCRCSLLFLREGRNASIHRALLKQLCLIHTTHLGGFLPCSATQKKAVTRLSYLWRYANSRNGGHGFIPKAGFWLARCKGPRLYVQTKRTVYDFVFLPYAGSELFYIFPKKYRV